MEATRMTDILDTVLRTLYEHMDKDGLNFDQDLLAANKIELSPEESDALWDVLRATGLADSIIGFGKEGRLELTSAGIQMMTRFGSYRNFLAAQKTGVPPQVTISVQDSGTGTPSARPDGGAEPAKPEKAASTGRKSR